MLRSGGRGRPRRSRVGHGHALHGRRHLVPTLRQGQRQRPGTDQGRQGDGQGHLPHTAPQRLPLKAQEVPRIAQGGVHEVPQQLPDMGQRPGNSARRAGAEGHGPDRPCRIGAVLRDLRQRPEQAAYTHPGEKSVSN